MTKKRIFILLGGFILLIISGIFYIQTINSRVSSGELKKIKTFSSAFNDYYEKINKNMLLKKDKNKQIKFNRTFRLSKNANDDLEKLVENIKKENKNFVEITKNAKQIKTHVDKIKLIKKDFSKVTLDIEIFVEIYKKNLKLKDSMQWVDPFIVDFNVKNNQILDLHRVSDWGNKDLETIFKAKTIYTDK